MGGGCHIYCRNFCNILSFNYCEISISIDCYIKVGRGSQLKSGIKLIKTISEGEEFIWWYIDSHRNLINTFENEDWKKNNPNKWNEFYGFVHNELDLATLF